MDINPAVIIQQFFNALTLGAIYALIALGYTMVYGIIELINFAHGDVFMVGAFTGMWLLTVPLAQRGAINDPLLLAAILLLIFAITMPVIGLLGVGIERFAYRPLRNAPRLAPLLTAIGVSFILQNIIQTIFGPSPKTTPRLFPNGAGIDVGTVHVSAVTIFIFVMAVVLIIALQTFINRTRMGRAMRSTAQDREAAQLMGLNINRPIALTFFIGSELAGAGGIVFGLYSG
jgi:branched-chain amino acid transport system permease protein